MDLHASQFLLLALGHQVVELSGAVANQSPQVANKLVDKTLSLYLADHVSVVVISTSENVSETRGSFTYCTLV